MNMSEKTSPLLFDIDSMVDTVRESVLILDAELRVRRASRSFYRTFLTVPEDTEGRLIYELGNNQWDIPNLRHLLEGILPQQASFDDFEVIHNFERIGPKSCC
jgi:two-component system, chemotaxis family, CheB/CheR fusion protein